MAQYTFEATIIIEAETKHEAYLELYEADDYIWELKEIKE